MRNVKEKYEKAFGGIRAPQELVQKTMQAMLTEKQPQKKPPHRLFKSVAAGVVCAVFLCGMVVVPQMANQPKGNSFQIVAYAADNKKVALKKGESISIGRSQRTTEDIGFNDLGLMSYNLLQDNGDHLTIGVYCNPRLICEGNNIRSITYSTTQENASFAKVLWMDFGESGEADLTNPLTKRSWDIEEEALAKRLAEEGKTYVKRPYPLDEKFINQNYGNGGYSIEEGGHLYVDMVENRNGEIWEDGRNDIYFAFLPVGKDYTVDYRHQDNEAYEFALRFTTTMPASKEKTPWRTFWDFYWTDAVRVINGAKVTVTVTYMDDTTETKEIQLNYDKNVVPEDGFEYLNNLTITEL